MRNSYVIGEREREAQVMVLQERVAEAQRMASMELKEVCACFLFGILQYDSKSGKKRSGDGEDAALRMALTRKKTQHKKTRRF